MKIPVAMATQHSDSASRFVPVREEPEEAVTSFKREEGFGCDEYLVDYMGKLTPYHQIGHILRKLREETDLVPGEDVFITPRMVSSFSEEPFRQLMTTLAVIEGIYYCKENFDLQGINYMVQAITTSIEELKECKDRSETLLKLIGKHLHMDTSNMEIRVIPLLGGIAGHLSVKEVVPKIIEDLNIGEEGLRIFIGKSEPSLLYGHLASVLSCKLAISNCYSITDKSGVEIYPIFGGGALPFRGHITLENADNFLEEYRGVRTYTIQSAMRYDHGLEKTRALIEKIREGVVKPALQFSEEEEENMQRMAFIFAKNYFIELSEIAEKIFRISKYVPNQRERQLDFEEVSYYREMRNIRNILKLSKDKRLKRTLAQFAEEAFAKPPRWVKFVASTYTCGLPPEFIGTGNALKEIKETMGACWVERLLDEIYPSLREDIKYASRFLNLNEKENILLTEKIKKSIEEVREYVEFSEPESSYLILCDVANKYLREILTGERIKTKKLALLIRKGTVAEYLNGKVEENIGRLILDLGIIRNALA